MQGLHVLDGQEHSDEITVHHLLSHRSGIPDNWAQPEFLELILADLERRWTPEETIEFVKHKAQPAFPPGQGFVYSDPGYNLLGLIIEQVTGSALHEAFRELLLDPLGMDHTYRPAYEAGRPSLPGRPPSERYLDDLECTAPPAVMTADWGGGGLVSTTEDLDRFVRAFVSSEIFASPDTRDQMLGFVETSSFTSYGLGVSMVDFRRTDRPGHARLTPIWGHSGSSGNFMYYWPERDVVMIGTLNQLAAPVSVYDLLASIMGVVIETMPEQSGPADKSGTAAYDDVADHAEVSPDSKSSAKSGNPSPHPPASKAKRPNSSAT
jgi:CubicO group peptidase (beta-lactamase class C family)